jgi:hypothetical protein
MHGCRTPEKLGTVPMYSNFGPYLAIVRCRTPGKNSLTVPRYSISGAVYTTRPLLIILLERMWSDVAASKLDSGGTVVSWYAFM